MSKNDYWSEKEHEKYEKMRVEYEQGKIDLKNAQKISKITNTIIKAISIPAIIIGVLTLVFLILWVTLYWANLYERLNPDVFRNMEFLYDEKFVIISEKIDERQEEYKASPKSNSKIIFTAYKNGASVLSDYQYQACKYFVEEILDEETRSKLTIESKVMEGNEEFLTSYHAYLEPATFSQIEEYAEIMKKIREKAKEQNKRVYDFITSPSFIKIDNYHSNVQYSNDDYSVEDLQKQEKYRYINYLKNNNLSTEEVPKEELEKYDDENIHIDM